MHVAEVVDIGNVDAAGVAAPLRQALAQGIQLLGIVPRRPLQQVDAVGVVIAGDEFLGRAGTQVGKTGLDQQLHRPARARVAGVAVAMLVAAPGVVEVREVELVDAFVAHQLQQCRQIVGVVLGHGVAHADLHAGVARQADAVQRQREAAVEAAELVVGGADAVEADADIVEADVGDAANVGRIDQRAVAGQADVEAHLLGATADVVDVRAQQRLAAGQDQHRHAEGLQVVHHREHLGGAQFTGEVLVGGDGVAVLAGQVAAADQVPDQHRAARRARRCDGGGLQQALQVVGEAQHDSLRQ
ncbi:hypothetical protein D3C85_1119540 [compost metagenome]